MKVSSIMDEFLSINWHPPLEDIIDNVFIDEERMKQESAMYRIVRGTFSDPFDKFAFSDNDEAEDDEEDQEEEEGEQEEEDKNENQDEYEIKVKPLKYQKQKQQKLTQKAELTKPKFETYVPGILRAPYQYPKISELNTKQHSLCLRVLQLFSGSKKPEITQANREELETYMELKPRIEEEQKEFLELAKKHWDSSSLKVILEEFINMRWKSKIQNAKKFHRHYLDAGSMALTAERKIGLTTDSTLLEMGDVPAVIIPPLTRPYILSRNFAKLCQDFLPESQVHRNSHVLYKVPVSQDPNCKQLADQCGADLVISSGGLNCLANNCGPGFTSSWILPIVVKANDGRTVIYVDKPLPPTTMTVPQKNAWVYKYLLKINLLQPRHTTSIRYPEKVDKNDIDGELFDDLNYDELSRLEEETDNILPSGRKRKCDILETLQNKANAAGQSNEKANQLNAEYKILGESEKLDSELTKKSENKIDVKAEANKIRKIIGNDFHDFPSSPELELSIDTEDEGENDPGKSACLELGATEKCEILEPGAILETPESPPPETAILRSDVKIIPNGETSPNVEKRNDSGKTGNSGLGIAEKCDTLETGAILDTPESPPPEIAILRSEVNIIPSGEKIDFEHSCTKMRNERRNEEIGKSISRDGKRTEISKNEFSEEKRANAFLKPPPGSNVIYRVFTIGSVESLNNRLMENIVDNYKILVRSRIDGVEKLKNGQLQPVMLAPKLEHQVALGAEAVTIEEAIKQWTTLIFRPETSLRRVRVSVDSSEVLQVEKRTPISISNEIKRLYNVDCEESLILLHNIIREFKTAKPGRYLLRHTVRNGAFATIYGETEGSGKNVFDLHTVYGDEALYTLPNAPWPALDKMVITPANRCFQQLPAMFRPRKVFNTTPTSVQTRSAATKKRTKKKKNNGNSG